MNESRLGDYIRKHAGARPGLQRWLKITKHALWRNFAEVRQTFGSADQLKIDAQKTAVIFDIGGGKFRLIAIIHYGRGQVFIRNFLTHAEYSKGRWKSEL